MREGGKGTNESEAKKKKKYVSEKCSFMAGNFIHFAWPETLGNLNVWSRLHYSIVRSTRYTERAGGEGD
jgi:hypothetical protein